MSRFRFHEAMTACEVCDFLNCIPPLQNGERFRCRHCGHVLVSVYEQAPVRILLTGLSCLLMLALAMSFPFLGFSSSGIERNITLFNLVSVLLEQRHLLLGAIISLALFVFPLVYLFSILFLVWSFQHRYPLNIAQRYCIRWVQVIQPWLMVDVFLVGILVALVKMMSFADISLELSFWAFCGYILLLLKTVALVDRRWLWFNVAGPALAPSVATGTAQQEGLIGCHFCGATMAGDRRHCDRCGHAVYSRRPNSVGTTTALLLASVVMYVPANVFPIMHTTFLGNTEPSTIMGGVLLLWSLGSYPVALVILFASVVIPIIKILSLGWLCWQCHFPSRRLTAQKIKLYQLTEFVGRWSMIDVFVVAILTSLVQMGNVIAIYPGAAVLSFSAVVIFTMLAAMTFDPRLLWDKDEALSVAAFTGERRGG
ncbi:PqiA/YebS family transporter subunit [Marinomonas sp. M1K-6]|uniref:PqiA/YebS family transporter subunit n=1 Tax=Marinomonas profundi TaxID=2726122 RepID=A0A847R435_9GAMM|nr:PqiA/YebS family transporter subunit [Marinomonas profundi]NLQ16756.1 PqiA/YebS family transporter subunit [Marinomonas profundi]UDV02490.1 PqiA/YebS family transporter subunit [Marinomonas profundi]